jgi:gliding motility-associated lipoprotein GldB
LEQAIEQIDARVEIVRFEKVFANAGIADLPQLKAEYPIFFPERFPDSIWQARLTDSLQQQLESATMAVFPDDEELHDQLLPLFQHLKYYFPGFVEPRVYTTTSDVDYRNKVIYADSLLILSLDTYLGSDHEFYQGIKRYISKNMKPDQIAPDVAEAIVQPSVPPPSGRQFIDYMVYHGKLLYLTELLLPEVPQASLIGYTPEEFQWALDNEEDIWRYFIEKELLYSTDPKLAPRFINPAPFSKFYLEIDNESPGMIGRYMGWQIVRSFARETELPLADLLRLPADRLFKESKYKPRR